MGDTNATLPTDWTIKELVVEPAWQKVDFRLTKSLPHRSDSTS